MVAVALKIALQYSGLGKTVAFHQVNAHTLAQGFAETAVTGLGDQAPAQRHQIKGAQPRRQHASVGMARQGRIRADEHMVRPALQRGRRQIQAQATKADQHASLPRDVGRPAGRQIQCCGQLGKGSRVEPRPRSGEPDGNLRNAPVDRHRQRAANQQLPLAVGRQGGSGPGGKGRTHGPIDRFPAEAGQPHQRSTQAGGQACGGRRHVTQNQDRLVGVTALRLKPCRLAGDLGGQADLQVLQSLQGGRGIGAQGIGLDHTHIPLAGAVVKRHRAHRQFQKTTRQRAREHQAPVGSARRQRRQNRRTAGPMPESVGADAGNDQHGNGSTPTGSADGVRSNSNS